MTVLWDRESGGNGQAKYIKVAATKGNNFRALVVFYSTTGALLFV